MTWLDVDEVTVLMVAERDEVPEFLAELARNRRYRPLGRVATVPAAAEAVKKHRPDVVLADVGTARRVDELAELMPTVTTLVVSALPPDAALLSVMAAGARGFVWKPVEPGLLDHALAVVAAGLTYLDPRAADWLVHLVLEEHAAKSFGLSSRQAEVLQLARTGLTNKEIAAALRLSVDTVKTHLRDAMRKLDVHDRWKAVARLDATAHSRGGSGVAAPCPVVPSPPIPGEARP